MTANNIYNIHIIIYLILLMNVDNVHKIILYTKIYILNKNSAHVLIIKFIIQHIMYVILNVIKYILLINSVMNVHYLN